MLFWQGMNEPKKNQSATIHAMERISGQKKAIDVLSAALSSGKLHHAYIFHGPLGVGKYSTAVAFAKTILCHNPIPNLIGQLAACGHCESCTLFRAIDQATFHPETITPETLAKNEEADEAGLKSAHPDLHIVVKELARYSDNAQIRNRKLTSIPVEVIQTHVIEPVYHAPALKHGKVFIIDEAELMNPFGQNAILKTLEEPPAGTVLILITSSEDRLLPTIRSRCQRIAFTPLDDNVVRRWLEDHHPDEMRGLDDSLRDWLTAFSAGSLGRAVMVLNYKLTEWAQAILPAIEGIAQGHPSGELGSMMASRIDEFAKAWVDSHKGASKEAANKLAAKLMWGMIAEHARAKVQHLSSSITPGDLAAGDNLLEPWLKVVDAITAAEDYYASNVKIDLVCDHLVMEMTKYIYKTSV